MRSKKIPLGEARAKLSSLVEDVQHGSLVELTRRGKTVAVILSATEYSKLARAPGFEQAMEEFRKRVRIEELDLSPELFEGIRDRSPGREVSL